MRTASRRVSNLIHEDFPAGPILTVQFFNPSRSSFGEEITVLISNGQQVEHGL